MMSRSELTPGQRKYILSRMSSKMTGNQWADFSPRSEEILDLCQKANPEWQEHQPMNGCEIVQNMAFHLEAGRPSQPLETQGQFTPNLPSCRADDISKTRALAATKPGSAEYQNLAAMPAHAFDSHAHLVRRPAGQSALASQREERLIAAARTKRGLDARARKIKGVNRSGFARMPKRIRSPILRTPVSEDELRCLPSDWREIAKQPRSAHLSEYKSDAE